MTYDDILKWAEETAQASRNRGPEPEAEANMVSWPEVAAIFGDLIPTKAVVLLSHLHIWPMRTDDIRSALAEIAAE